VETLILPAFIVWLGLAIIIGVAANTRGRNGGGWFILATFISPLLAGLLLLALPRRSRRSRETIPGYGVHFSEVLPGGGQRREARRTREQNERDRREGVFRPDGMIGETPYRILPNGEAEAIIRGGVVRFRSLDHLRSMTNTAAPQTDLAGLPDATTEKIVSPVKVIFSSFIRHSASAVCSGLALIFVLALVVKITFYAADIGGAIVVAMLALMCGVGSYYFRPRRYVK
jgi:hypothetical protein